MTKEYSSFGFSGLIFVKMNLTPRREIMGEIYHLGENDVQEFSKSQEFCTMSTFNTETKDPIIPRYSLFYLFFVFSVLMRFFLACCQCYSPKEKADKKSDQIQKEVVVLVFMDVASSDFDRITSIYSNECIFLLLLFHIFICLLINKM